MTSAQSDASLIASLQAQVNSNQPQKKQANIRYYAIADKLWDPITTSNNIALLTTVATKVTRLRSFHPFFDSLLGTIPNAHVYYDLYAIYVNDPVATQHPEWILKDSVGNNLYIPFADETGVCNQFAGDLSNPDFVAYQVNRILIYLAGSGKHYKGVFVDDVNMSVKTGDVNANLVPPVDRTTGRSMTVFAWQSYVVNALAAIRNALKPDYEIVHNAVWYDGLPSTSPLITAQVSLSDYGYVERGFGYSGITGGTGSGSLSQLFTYISDVHRLGKSVVIGEYLVSDLIYSLGCFFLITNGDDYIGFADQVPAMNLPYWPDLYNLNLGDIQGSKFWNTDGTWRRQFSRGGVIVNEPQQGQKIVTLPAGAMDVNGTPYTKLNITLNAKQSLIYHL